MQEYWEALNNLEKLFLVCAIFGGALFFVRVAMMFMGFVDVGHGADVTDIGHDTDVMDIGHDADVNIDTGAEGHTGEVGDTDSDVGFRILTLQGISSFLLMFGLVGMGTYREMGFPAPLAVFVGGAAGLGTVWVLGKMFSFALRMHSSGTVDAMGSVGGEGTVYLSIPEGGKGIVQVFFKDRMREYDAVSHDGSEIKTGQRVKVVWVNGNVLSVEKID